jgi:hypothetical protein
VAARKLKEHDLRPGDDAAVRAPATVSVDLSGVRVLRLPLEPQPRRVIQINPDLSEGPAVR